MSIELHCSQCGKLIRAPDTAGGRHGKCPYCEGRVYIPLPPDDNEEIGMAPIDEEAERREEQLRHESIEYSSRLAHETSDIGEEGSPPGSEAAPGEVIELADEVERFVVAMRDSELDEADRVVTTLKKTGGRARDYVEGLILDEMPPQVENVPPPVLTGFLKTLLNRLG